MPDDAGLDDLAGRVHHASDRALGSNSVPQPAARVDAFQPPVLPRALEPVKIPPGNAVHRFDNRGLWPEQRLNPVDDSGKRRRLERDDDVVLGTDLGRVVGATQPDAAGLAVDEEGETLGLHGLEMGAARD